MQPKWTYISSVGDYGKTVSSRLQTTSRLMKIDAHEHTVTAILRTQQISITAPPLHPQMEYPRNLQLISRHGHQEAAKQQPRQIYFASLKKLQIPDGSNLSTYQPKPHYPIILSDCLQSVAHRQDQTSAIGNPNPFQPVAWISRLLHACPLPTPNPIIINYLFALRTVKYHSVTSRIAQGNTHVIYAHVSYSEQDSIQEAVLEGETWVINRDRKVLGAAPDNPNLNLLCTSQTAQSNSPRKENTQQRLMIWSEKTSQQVIMQAFYSQWASFFEQMASTHGPQLLFSPQSPHPPHTALSSQGLPSRSLSHPNLLTPQSLLRSSPNLLTPHSPLCAFPSLFAPQNPLLPQKPQHTHSSSQAPSSPSPQMLQAPSQRHLNLQLKLTSSISNQNDTQPPPLINNSPNTLPNMLTDADPITPLSSIQPCNHDDKGLPNCQQDEVSVSKQDSALQRPMQIYR